MHDSSILAFQKVKQHHSHLLLRHVYYFFLCYQPKNDVCAQKGPWLVRWQSPMVAFFFFFMGQEKRKRILQLVHCSQTQESHSVESKRDE